MPYQPTRPRKFLKPTSVRLANAALFYLERYAASEASLRRVLQNKIRRACLRDEAFAADHEAHVVLQGAIETIIEKHKKSGVINDQAYAVMKVSSLRRSGKSARRITQSLMQKGVAAELVKEALCPEEEESQNAEMKAALSYAKRRRLGSFRKDGPTDDYKIKSKEIASMARAGFSLDTAKKILGGEGLEDVFEDA